ncbi:CPW-WPC family protein, putative [Plasmodium ovale]|uniref:CPW-WPC family protein, putative n=1 Tax=Plasmodium ovale TaxID=36330 RepID=A0A1C3KU48_PLAOA|nr:CPW-WPC family protein, putative [Plasmodium ovale]
MGYLFAFFFFLLFRLSDCMLPWTKKRKAVNQMAIIKDMSNEIKNKSQLLPTPKDIANRIHKLDSEVIEKLNEDIIQEENFAKHKPHICQEPSYERDYSYLCPEDWVKNSNDQCCRGIDYDGHCESLKYFQYYSDEEKREFELNCCVVWPKLKNVPRKNPKGETLRGSINAYNGIIVKPKNA